MIVVLILLVLIAAFEGIFLKQVLKKYRKKELKVELLEGIIHTKFLEHEKEGQI